MNFLQFPELLPELIEGYTRDFNILADVFAEETSDYTFAALYTICEESNFLSVYDCCPTYHKSPHRVHEHYNLLTEIVLRGAKRIWVNPRNKFKKRIAGLYMLSILYSNQPMSDYPVKIPLDAKEMFFIIVNLFAVLLRSKRMVRVLCMYNEALKMLQRLSESGAFTFTFESEYFNILPDSRTVIETFEKLDFVERLNRISTKQRSLTYTAENPNVEARRLTHSLSVTNCDSSALEKYRKNEEISHETSIVPYHAEKATSTESGTRSQNYNWERDDDDSECEESGDDDGYELLLSGDVPPLEDSLNYRKTAASMEAREEALKLLISKNRAKPSLLKVNSKEDKGKADVNLILKTIKAAKEKCYAEGKDKRNEQEFAFPPELLKLKQEADESVRVAYGVIQPETHMTEKMWLSKDVKNGSKALSIFSMHRQGTLDKNEGIRLVSKYFNNTHEVLVERVRADMDEEILNSEDTEKKNNRARLETKGRLEEIRHWDSLFYQPKYMNNYHRQLQKTVEEMNAQKHFIDAWAQRFVKRFRLENGLSQAAITSDDHMDENRGRNWLFNNFCDRRIDNVNSSSMEMAIYNKYSRRQQGIDLPLKSLNTNDVELSEEAMEENDKESTKISQYSNCNSLVVSPRKDLKFSTQTKYDLEMSDYSDDDSLHSEHYEDPGAVSPPSSPKILSMPNLDSFFAVD